MSTTHKYNYTDRLIIGPGANIFRDILQKYRGIKVVTRYEVSVGISIVFFLLERRSNLSLESAADNTERIMEKNKSAGI